MCQIAKDFYEKFCEWIGEPIEVAPSDAWQGVFEAAITNSLTSQLQGIFETALQNVELDVNITNDELTITGSVTIDGQPIEVNVVSGEIALDAATIQAIADAIKATLEPLSVELTATNIADLITALEGAVLTVDVNGGNITVDGTVDIGNIADLANEIATALENANLIVTVDSLPPVVIDAQSIADLVTALEGATLTVTVDGQPIEVTIPDGVAVTNFDDLVTALIDAINASTDINVTVDNFDDLVTALEGTTLTVDIATMPDVVIDATQFQTLLDAIAASDLDDTDDDIRVDYEEVKDVCILNTDNKVVEGWQVYNCISTNELGIRVSTERVFMQDGAIVPLAAGLRVSECPKKTETTVVFFNETGSNMAVSGQDIVDAVQDIVTANTTITCAARIEATLLANGNNVFNTAGSLVTIGDDVALFDTAGNPSNVPQAYREYTGVAGSQLDFDVLGNTPEGSVDNTDEIPNFENLNYVLGGGSAMKFCVCTWYISGAAALGGP